MLAGPPFVVAIFLTWAIPRYALRHYEDGSEQLSAGDSAFRLKNGKWAVVPAGLGWFSLVLAGSAWAFLLSRPWFKGDTLYAVAIATYVVCFVAFAAMSRRR